MSTNKTILLSSNKGGHGNWYTGYIENLQSRSTELDDILSAKLSYVFTGVPFCAAFPNRNDIILEYTIPAVAAGQGVEAVDAIPPSDTKVDRLELERTSRRDKLMDAVRRSGTRAFQFLFDSMDHPCQVIIRADPRYIAADRMVPKDDWALFCLMKEKLAGGGAGGVRLTSQEIEKIDGRFNAFKQGSKDVNDYCKKSSKRPSLFVRMVLNIVLQ
jgi:hypothetical protein